MLAYLIKHFHNKSGKLPGPVTISFFTTVINVKLFNKFRKGKASNTRGTVNVNLGGKRKVEPVHMDSKISPNILPRNDDSFADFLVKLTWMLDLNADEIKQKYLNEMTDLVNELPEGFGYDLSDQENNEVQAVYDKDANDLTFADAKLLLEDNKSLRRRNASLMERIRQLEQSEDKDMQEDTTEEPVAEQ